MKDKLEVVYNTVENILKDNVYDMTPAEWNSAQEQIDDINIILGKIKDRINIVQCNFFTKKLEESKDED